MKPKFELELLQDRVHTFQSVSLSAHRPEQSLTQSRKPWDYFLSDIKIEFNAPKYIRPSLIEDPSIVLRLDNKRDEPVCINIHDILFRLVKMCYIE